MSAATERTVPLLFLFPSLFPILLLISFSFFFSKRIATPLVEKTICIVASSLLVVEAALGIGSIEK